MTKYYVNQNAQDDGYHEVHAEDCVLLPLLKNKEYIGDFPICGLAIIKARMHYKNVDGCIHCAKPCHTR